MQMYASAIIGGCATIFSQLYVCCCCVFSFRFHKKFPISLCTVTPHLSPPIALQAGLVRAVNIHANLVPGSGGQRGAYIAAQNPVEGTVEECVQEAGRGEARIDSAHERVLTCS